MPAQAFVQADLGLYMGKQGSKGTAASTLKGAIAFTKFENVPEIQAADAVPMLGPNGFYVQQSVGTAIKLTQRAEGWVGLELFPAMIFGAFMSKGSTTGSAAYTHPYSAIVKNILLPYITIGLVYGENTTAGSGIANGVHIIRDARLTRFKFTISSTDAIKWTAEWMALNMGSGSGSETFTPGSTYVIPNPNGTSNTYTLPSWIPDTVCINSIDFEWSAQTVQSPPCLGSGEYGDTLVTQAGWTLTFKMQLDANSVIAYNQVIGKADTLASGTTGALPGLKTGAFSFLANSDTVIPTTSTPYSLAGSFPSLQWTAATIDDNSPNELTLVAKTFGSDFTFTPVNATAGGSMTI